MIDVYIDSSILVILSADKNIKYTVTGGGKHSGSPTNKLSPFGLQKLSLVRLITDVRIKYYRYRLANLWYNTVTY